MLKKSDLCQELLMGVFIFIFSFSFVSAVGVSVTEISSTVIQVDISSATNLYAYEVSFDFTGSITSVDFAEFLGAGTSTGSNERGTVLYVYESRLDSAQGGISGGGNLFNVTHSGDLDLTSALFIANDSTETSADYTYCGDGTCDSGETCSSCSTDCGACAVAATSSSGGGGVIAAKKLVETISVDINHLTLNLVLNSNKERIIKITNNGALRKEIRLGQENLNDIVIFKEDSFSLGPGESREIRVVFLASKETGIIAGKIFIAGTEILISINTVTKELLFDAMIIVSEQDKIIEFGDKLNTQITLIPMGGDLWVDVTLNYLIKDFEGRIYLEESETFLITEQKNFIREFHTRNLPVGNYVVGLEVVYPNGVAVSSSHFEIVKEKPLSIGGILIGVIAGIVILGGIIIILMIRYHKKRKHLLLKIKRQK